MASLSVQGPYLQRLFIFAGYHRSHRSVRNNIPRSVRGFSEHNKKATVRWLFSICRIIRYYRQILRRGPARFARSGHRRFSALLRSGFSHNGCIPPGVAQENQDPADVIEQNGRNVGTGRESGGQEADSENHNQQGDHRNPRGA